MTVFPGDKSTVPPLLLLVDDVPHNLATLKAVLEPAGYVTVTAESGEEALKVLRSLRPGLILLDIRMPGRDGFEVCREIKTMPGLEDTPVIFLSGLTETEDKVAAFRHGGVDFIVKPWQKEEVLARVQTHLALSSALQELQESREDLDRRVQERTAALQRANAELVSEVRQRRKAEQALLRSEAQLKESQRIGKLGYWEHDAETGELSWSEELASLLGCRPEHSPSFQRLYRPFEQAGTDLVRQRIESLGREPGSFGEDLPVRLDDGREAVYRLRIRSVVGAAGRIDLRGTVQDVTEVSRLEAKLRQAEKLKAVGQLAGGVAHDFNNQLTGILGFAEILLAQLDDPSDVSCVREIINFANRAARLTSQLLAFARKESMEERAVDVHGVLGEVLCFTTAAVDRGVKVEQSLEAENAVVWGNRSRLEDALMKVLLNAADAVQGEGTVRCETRVVESGELDGADLIGTPGPGPWLTVRLSDDGIGMSSEVQSRMFEPFFTTSEERAGLGLASVYGTVTGHGGALRVRSRLGEGTSVEILLPLQDANAESPAPPGATHPEIRVLVIEEETALRDLLGAMLTDLSYKVTAVGDPSKALAVYEKDCQELELVLLDLSLSRIGGLAVFRELRRINPTVRVVLLSGQADSEVAETAVTEGALGVVNKPFRLNELSGFLRRAVLVEKS